MRRYLKKKHVGAMKGSEALVLCFHAATAATLLQCKSSLRRARAISNLQTRAEALVCVGQAFNRLRTPEAFLDAIENKPWPIEETYPPETRFNLSLERSNARRYVRRLHEALPLAKELPPLAATLPDPKAPRMLRLNIGILERDTGRPDKAIEALTSLLGDCPDLERLDVLQSPAIA